MKHYDYLIVGAGLFGSAFAYKAARNGKKCMVIERREHVGGNLRCEELEGIMVHWYGPHIFHTSDKRVWDFVNSITPFDAFVNAPLARYGNKLYNLPFNMNTFHQMWGCITPDEAKSIIGQQQQEALLQMKKEGVTEPRNLEEQALLLVGRDIYERLIKGYTEKQWGRPCCELPAFIIKRLPVRFTYDNNYFSDRYQGIPRYGYNDLIEEMLADADVYTCIDFFEKRSEWERCADKIVYTGPLDRFFDYKCGKLDWRSLEFKHISMHRVNYQGNAVVNYTDASIPYTRIIEHKHFVCPMPDIESTVITYEYPVAYGDDKEPYYPINDERNIQLAERYKQLAGKEPNVIFGGRLAEYKYYDMDAIIARVLEL